MKILAFFVFVVLLAIIFVAIFGLILPKHRRAEMAEFSICEARFNEGKYQESAELLEEFIKDHSRSRKSADAYYYLARSRQNLEDYPQAMIAWTKIIKKYPKSKNIAEAYYYLGFIQENNKQYDDAMENYRTVVDRFADTPIVAGALLGMGKIYEIKGLESEALNAYQNLMDKYPVAEFAIDAERRLGSINLKRFLEKNAKTYKVGRGESLVIIARKFHITPALIMELSNLKTKALNTGQTLRVIDAGNFNILIDLSDRRLSLRSGDKVIKKYPVCVGKEEASTPIGDFKVTDKMVDPTWYSTAPTGAKEIIPSGDPRNELGTRWIGFKPAYGIHGTIFPKSIGKAESRGCIRMYMEDVEELYDLVAEGIPLKIVL